MFDHLTFLGTPLRRVVLVAAAGFIGIQGAQAQTFQKTYDDGFTYAAVSQSVRQTADQGYITAGYAMYWGGATEVLLSKTTNTGGLVWTKLLLSGVPNQNYNDMAFAVREIRINGVTTGYIVVGTTHEAATGAKDVLVIRTDQNGNPQWRKAYGGTFGDDVAYNVEVVPDQAGEPNKVNFVVVGYADGGQSRGQSVLLMRLADNGNVNWIRKFGAPPPPVGDEANVGFAVQPVFAGAGGFVLTGYTNPSGRIAGLDKAPFVIRTNNFGFITWGPRPLQPVRRPLRHRQVGPRGCQRQLRDHRADADLRRPSGTPRHRPRRLRHEDHQRRRAHLVQHLRRLQRIGNLS